MIEIPIWLFVLMIVCCVPTIFVAVSFAAFMVTNAIRDIIDEKQSK